MACLSLTKLYNKVMKDKVIIHVSNTNSCTNDSRHSAYCGLPLCHEYSGKVCFYSVVKHYWAQRAGMPAPFSTFKHSQSFKIIYNFLFGEVEIFLGDRRIVVYAVDVALTAREYRLRYLRKHLLTVVSPKLHSRSGDGLVTEPVKEVPVVVNDENPWTAFFLKKNRVVQDIAKQRRVSGHNGHGCQL